MRFTRALGLVLSALLAANACKRGAPALQAPSFDVVIRGGTVYDGSGAAGRRADVGIRGDRITTVGDLSTASAPVVTDATGLAVVKCCTRVGELGFAGTSQAR